MRIKQVEKLHRNFSAVFQTGKKEISIKCRRRVRQGDNLAPTLFAIDSQLSVENIYKCPKNAS